MKVWDAVYHPQGGYLVLTTNDGVIYLDGTMGHKVSGEREAGKKRSGEVATPPPLSIWDQDRSSYFTKCNAPEKIPVVRIDDRTKVCPLCDGKTAPATIPALREPCSFCAGRGKVFICHRCGGLYKTGSKCLICEGKGLSVCPDCDGFGEQLLGVPCKTCGGMGHLTKRRNPLK